MKKLLPLLILFSCSQQSISEPQNKHSVTVTGQKVVRAGGIFDLKLSVNIQRADSATKIELCHADFRAIYDVPLTEGNQVFWDYQINQFSTQTTYIVRSYLLGGEVRYTQPTTISH